MQIEFNRSLLSWIYVTTKKIITNFTKEDTIINLPSLFNVKIISNFLRFANFYRVFVQGLNKIATPWICLIQKKMTFESDVKCFFTLIF